MYIQKFLNEARNHDRKMQPLKVKNALGLSAVLTKLFSTNFKLLIQNINLCPGEDLGFSRGRISKNFQLFFGRPNFPKIPSSPKSLKRPNFDETFYTTAEFLKKQAKKRRF